jgi:hypothetical protein
MEKQRCKYSWKDKKWNELYRVNNDVVVITGIIKPDGTHQQFTFNGSSAIADHYIKEYSNKG